MVQYDFIGHCLTSDSHSSWYKDGELLEFSHPNYITLKDDHITIVANAINEGTYTCVVKKKDKVLTNYSWRVRVRFWRPRLLLCKLNRTHSHTVTWRPHSLWHIFLFVKDVSPLSSTHSRHYVSVFSYVQIINVAQVVFLLKYWLWKAVHDRHCGLHFIWWWKILAALVSCLSTLDSSSLDFFKAPARNVVMWSKATQGFLGYHQKNGD